MNVEFDYDSYISAIKALSEIKNEMEAHEQRMVAQHACDRERIEADRQGRIEQLEQIRTQAVKHFLDVSLRYHEVCQAPTEQARPVACAMTVEEALNAQAAAADRLHQALDGLVADRKAKEEKEAKRREEERRRRQAALDEELARARYKPPG